jgi:diguanylate cyclase (GGDEF)-like protein
VADEEEFERIRREHALLIESIEVTPTPFAVYDERDRLIAWNEPYERVHALAFKRLREKADRRELHYSDLVRVIAEETMHPAEVEDYVRRRVLDQRNADGIGVDREYPGAGWFRISKFKTRSGAIAGFAIDINENKKREAQLEQEIHRRMELEEQLRVQANTDSLTGLASRGAFLAQAETDFRRAKRYGHDLSAIMMDADLFKEVNDAHGHGVGDSVLVTLASAAANGLRKDIDMVGRVGGEEFAMVLVHTGIKDAVACAERIRASVAAMKFEDLPTPFGITASFGVTQRNAEDRTFSAMLNRADQALYRAKSGGRNRIEVR